jgi:hypothetical protein
MRTTHAVARGSAWILTAMLVSTGCREHGTQEQIAAMRRQPQQLIALAAERDSLIREVAANGALMTDITSELDRIQVKKASTPESPDLRTTLNDRQYLLSRVKDVAARVKESESRLVASQRRINRLVNVSDSLRAGLTAYRNTVNDLTAVLEAQRASLVALTAKVNGLQVWNEALQDTVNTLADRNSTAYFVVGTRKELLEKGLVAEEGGRFPIFGKKAIAPSRDIPLREFTSIDTRTIGEIPLPRSDRKYRIVSRQNLVHLAGGTDKKGRISGSIRIASAEGFWEPSKYLIVVEQ